MGMAHKTGIPKWVALVSGNMDQNLRNPSSLIVSPCLCVKPRQPFDWEKGRTVGRDSPLASSKESSQFARDMRGLTKSPANSEFRGLANCIFPLACMGCQRRGEIEPR